MVSNIKYNSFKDFDLKSKVPHLAILLIIVIFALVQVAPPIVLFFVFFVYALSGPFGWLQTRRKALQKLSSKKNKKTDA